MAQHTPGPWKIDKDTEVPWTEGNAEIAVEYGESFGPVTLMFEVRGGEPGDDWPVARLEWEPLATQDRQKEIRANARLIAAAPTLLEALEGLTSRVYVTHGDDDFWDDVMQPARAAIAAAMGDK